MERRAARAETSAEAARVYYEILRRLGPAGRMRLFAELNATLRAVLAAGVRHRHPEYDEEQVRLAVARLTLGEELFRKAYPGLEVRP